MNETTLNPNETKYHGVSLSDVSTALNLKMKEMRAVEGDKVYSLKIGNAQSNQLGNVVKTMEANVRGTIADYKSKGYTTQEAVDIAFREIVTMVAKLSNGSYQKLDRKTGAVLK